MQEDKQSICDILAEALKATRAYYDLVSLTFIPETEEVEVRFAKGSYRINVALDSGSAMIRDIVNHMN